MADGVLLNDGTGTITATTDDCGLSGHTQVMKLAISANGDATLIPADATNGLQVNVTKIVPGTTATALGKAEDDAAASGDVGVAVLTVRQDAPAGTTSADGDYQSLKTDSVGRLWVNASGAAVPVTDNGGTLSIDDGAGSITVDGTVAVSGAVAVTDNAGSLTVDNGGTFVVQENGAALTSLQLIDNLVLSEDAAAASGDPGVQLLTVRQDSIAGSTSADGDYQSAKTNSVGALYTSLSHLGANALSTGNGTAGTGCQRVTIASDNTAFSVNATLQASTNTQEVVGDAAHDAPIAGNPVRMAGRALTSDYTAVAAGDTADLITTLLGKLVTIPYANPANTWSYAAASGGITNTTGVTAKTAGAAGVRNYITHVDVVNGHATVDTDVQIRDGAAGTVLWRGFAKAAGGGVSADFNPPLRGTAATLVEIACGTTGTATYFNLTGFQAAE